MCARPGGKHPPGLFYLLPAWYNSIKKQAEHRVSTLWQRAPGRPLAAEAFVPECMIQQAQKRGPCHAEPGGSAAPPGIARHALRGGAKRPCPKCGQRGLSGLRAHTGSYANFYKDELVLSTMLFAQGQPALAWQAMEGLMRRGAPPLR